MILQISLFPRQAFIHVGLHGFSCHVFVDLLLKIFGK